MKTKIICTIGPATETHAMIEGLARAGMSIARVNCSHGSAERSREIIRTLKKVRDQKKLDFQIMLDTKGPDVRIGSFDGGYATIHSGAEFVLSAQSETMGSDKGVFVGLSDLAKKVKIGTEVLINDGKIRLTVREVRGGDVVTRVEVGGIVSNNKTIYIPGVDMGLPFLSDVDKADLRMGIEESVDMVAASFVSSAKDVAELKGYLTECCPKAPLPLLVAKIESSKGVKNLTEILRDVDGVMVARGDLGVEYPVEKIPTLQKWMVETANSAKKFVIVATEMMESMIKNVRPTRAEVGDIALAVWQRAGAVMLSAETAVGDYPLQAVEYMKRVVVEAEKSGISFTCVCKC